MLSRSFFPILARGLFLKLLKKALVLANSEDPDEMPLNASCVVNALSWSSLLQMQRLSWLRICCSQHFSQMEKVGANEIKF